MPVGLALLPFSAATARTPMRASARFASPGTLPVPPPPHFALTFHPVALADHTRGLLHSTPHPSLITITARSAVTLASHATKAASPANRHYYSSNAGTVHLSSGRWSFVGTPAFPASQSPVFLLSPARCLTNYSLLLYFVSCIAQKRHGGNRRIELKNKTVGQTCSLERDRNNCKFPAHMHAVKKKIRWRATK